MPSTFFGLEIARRGMVASQIALEVIGHNTANVNTPGYSRQIAGLVSGDPTSVALESGLAQLGTGVTVGSISRIRDEYLDRRIYSASGDQGALVNLRDTLARVEAVYGEPGGNGIGQLLTDFFKSFSELSNKPEDEGLRNVVRGAADKLAGAFRGLNSSLSQFAVDGTARITAKIAEANDIGTQLAALNKQIRTDVAAGQAPNDLYDQRGALLDRLSGIVDFQITSAIDPNSRKPNGEILVTIGGSAFVQGGQSTPLPTTTSVSGSTVGLTTSTGAFIPLRTGELTGIIKGANQVAGYQADLNTLASTLITNVNARHSVGYGLDGATGRPFFSGSDAGSIAVSAAIMQSSRVIAAANPPVPPNNFSPGNGENARAIFAIGSTALLNGQTLNGYYNGRIASIGADSRSYKSLADNQQKLTAALRSQQSSISGVSLDEELTRMMQFQRGYQAAARVINVMDDVLNTVINNLGHR